MVVNLERSVAHSGTLRHLWEGKVGNNQSNITNDDFHTYLTDKPNLNLKFNLITVKEITDIIYKLKPKSSRGLDELSNKVIIHIREIIAEPFTIIVNQKQNTGLFPATLKSQKLYHYLKKTMINFF